MLKLPDNYAVRARTYPALLATAPAFALAAAILSWQQISISSVGALIAVSVLFFAIADLARQQGKRIELKLYKELGGNPSTLILRHHDNFFPSATKDRFRNFLASVLDEKPPTIDLENQDSIASDAFYERCGNWLREQTRDTHKYKLLFEENITYGFRRNLLGLKQLALWVSSITMVICLIFLYFRSPVSVYDSFAIGFIAVMAVCAMQTSFFLFCVSKSAVIEASYQYARQLLLSCETLQNEFLLRQQPTEIGRV